MNDLTCMRRGTEAGVAFQPTLVIANETNCPSWFEGKWRGPGDLCGEVAAKWDEERLYVYAYVMDDLICHAHRDDESRLHDGDSVEICLRGRR